MLLATGVAAAGPSDGGHDTMRVLDEEVTIDDVLVTISDTSVSGPGLPDVDIQDRTYSVDTTLDIEGLEFTFAGTTYEFCDVTINFENIGVHLEDVTLSDGS